MNRKLIPCLCALTLALLASDLDAGGSPYVLSITGGEVAPGGSIDSAAVLDSSLGGPVQGWSYGVCHDSLFDLTITGVVNGSTTNTVKNGGPPDFNETNLDPDGAGYTVGIVICFTGCATLAPTASAELSVASYDNMVPDGGITFICPCSTLGNPAVATVVVVGGASITPTQNCGTVLSVAPVIDEFIRSDCNSDGLVNIADGIYNLNQLFQGGPASTCSIACDSNANGTVDAADSVFTFNYQFLDGPMPSAPFPACGLVPGQTPEDCIAGCP